MKQTNHFVPGQDGRLSAWAANYKEKIAVLGPQFGLTAEQILQITKEEATYENKQVFVKKLLQKTSHSLQEIADFADVSIDFVLKIKKQLKLK